MSELKYLDGNGVKHLWHKLVEKIHNIYDATLEDITQAKDSVDNSLVEIRELSAAAVEAKDDAETASSSASESLTSIQQIETNITNIGEEIQTNAEEAANLINIVNEKAITVENRMQDVEDIADSIQQTKGEIDDLSSSIEEVANTSIATMQESVHNADVYAARAADSARTADIAATKATTNANNANRYASNSRAYAATAEQQVIYATDARNAAEEVVRKHNNSIAPVENDAAADRDYSVNNMFVYDNSLYRVTRAISRDETINPGVNCEKVTIAEQLELIAQTDWQGEIDTKADKRDTVLETTLSRGRKEGSVVGSGSFAFGVNVEASGNSSYAEGTKTVASATGSHAEGNLTTASGNMAHSEGFKSTASGVISHAEGMTTIANGNYSHAEGGNTIAASVFQHVQGRWNVADPNNEYSDIVGNGFAENDRGNASALDWEGNLKLAGDVYVHANPDSTGGDKLATEDYVDTAVSNINSMSIHICTSDEYDSETEIPTITEPDASTFYLVPGGDAPNLYIEWVYVDEAWEKFGSATIDLSNYVQKTDYAGHNTPGVVSVFNTGGMSAGLKIMNRGQIGIDPATDSIIKAAASTQSLDVYRPLTANKQHAVTFYGFAKAAGDTTQYQSSNAVGTYTDEAKTAIQTMLDVPSKSDIPVNVSSLTNDAGYLTAETDPTVPNWAKASTKPTYTKDEIGLNNVDNVRQYSASNPPPSDTTKQNKITATGLLMCDGNGNVTAAEAGVDYGTEVVRLI